VDTALSSAQQSAHSDDTLHHCGFVEKIDEKHYRLVVEVRPHTRFRIGYASQGQDSSFPREVHASLVQAAQRERLELIVVDNRYQAKVALRARSKGIVAGVKETLHVADMPIVVLDGDGQFKTSLEKVRRHLRLSKARRMLVGAANDPSALGVVRAFQEAGRESTCAVVGQNAEPEARVELRERHTPLVASVGYFPERYGAGLVRLALDILSHRPVPPAMFMRHQLITPENVDHFYPNDALLGVSGAAAV
jgi:hypothetical protein